MVNGQSAFDVPSPSRIELRPRVSIWIEQAQLVGSASAILGIAATIKRRCRWP